MAPCFLLRIRHLSNYCDLWCHDTLTTALFYVANYRIFHDRQGTLHQFCVVLRARSPTASIEEHFYTPLLAVSMLLSHRDRNYGESHMSRPSSMPFPPMLIVSQNGDSVLTKTTRYPSGSSNVLPHRSQYGLKLVTAPNPAFSILATASLKSSPSGR